MDHFSEFLQDTGIEPDCRQHGAIVAMVLQGLITHSTGKLDEGDVVVGQNFVEVTIPLEYAGVTTEEHIETAGNAFVQWAYNSPISHFTYKGKEVDVPGRTTIRDARLKLNSPTLKETETLDSTVDLV